MLTKTQKLNLKTNIKKLWMKFEGPDYLSKNQKRTQKEFAEFLGISNQYLNMILKDKRSGEKQLFNFSRILKISIEDLISDNFDRILDDYDFKKNQAI